MSKSLKNKIIGIVAAVLTLCCVLIEFGEAIGLPSWQEIAAHLELHDTAPPAEGVLEVHIVDVGNADCILVRQGEHTMLIDAGERGDADTILDYLDAYDIERLDLVVATHPHADHIGSMADIIREIEVGEFLMAYMPEENTPTTATYLDMLEALFERDVTVTEAQPRQTYTLGTAKLQVLAPITEDDDPNAMSVVTRLSFGDNRFLFMGDAESGVERQMMNAGYALSADVLKVGHHGSNTGTHDAFLERVDPTYAVFTCGKGNSYGHPHREVVDKLRAADVAAYRSDMHGHIVFTADGKTVSVITQKEVA